MAQFTAEEIEASAARAREEREERKEREAKEAKEKVQRERDALEARLKEEYLEASPLLTEDDWDAVREQRVRDYLENQAASIEPVVGRRAF